MGGVGENEFHGECIFRTAHHSGLYGSGGPRRASAGRVRLEHDYHKRTGTPERRSFDERSTDADIGDAVRAFATSGEVVCAEMACWLPGRSAKVNRVRPAWDAICQHASEPVLDVCSFTHGKIR
jgi:hypothetical protein